MGFFDLFKPKEKLDEKLLKLQNIVYGTNYDKIVFSKQQILDTANNIYVPRIIEIFNDSAELVDNTLVPDTFFFRLDLATEKLQQLANVEELIVFDSPLPSVSLNNLINKYELYIQQFLERYIKNCTIEIDELKTQKGKINKIEKYLSEIYLYKDKFSDSHLEYLQNVKETQFNIKFYEKHQLSDFTNNCRYNSKIPYYLDESLVINYDELIKEQKEINSLCSNTKDQKYFYYTGILKKLKDSINYKFDDENINLCTKGFDLSLELCTYCITQNYDTSNFVIYETKGYYDFFKDQLNYKTMNSKYEKASSLEKEGYFEKALELYLKILEEYYPKEYNFYSYPFNLAITIFEYETAYQIFEYLKKAIHMKNIVNLDDLLNRFEKELNKLVSIENFYTSIKQNIIELLNSNPGILQTDVYKILGLENKESFRFILYYWEKINIIHREKSGRSYKVFLN